MVTIVLLDWLVSRDWPQMNSSKMSNLLGSFTWEQTLSRMVGYPVIYQVLT